MASTGITKKQRQRLFDRHRTKAISDFLRAVEHDSIMDSQTYLLELLLRDNGGKDIEPMERKEIVSNNVKLINFIAEIQFLHGTGKATAKQFSKVVKSFMAELPHYKIVKTQNQLFENYTNSLEFEENTGIYRAEMLINNSVLLKFLAKLQWLVRPGL